MAAAKVPYLSVFVCVLSGRIFFPVFRVFRGQIWGYSRFPVPICRESPGKSKLPGKILQNIWAILTVYTQFDKKLRPVRRLIIFRRE
jgi:hypothetical protein